jgi:dTMP kinase
MKLIYLLGTDGAGKTTVTQRLLRQGFPGRRTRYLYCQHRPFLLWLAKLPARLLFLRRADQFRDYPAYKGRKESAVRRHPWLLRAYVWLWYCDVWLQTWPRVAWARTRTDVLVFDRYYLDWVVNLSVLQDHDLKTMLRSARTLERTLPRATLHLFLDVSEDTAFRRKSDIQSVEYLRERKARYLQLADAYHFVSIDADQPLDAVVADATRHAAAHLESPHHA